MRSNTYRTCDKCGGTFSKYGFGKHRSACIGLPKSRTSRRKNKTEAFVGAVPFSVQPKRDVEHMGQHVTIHYCPSCGLKLDSMVMVKE